MKKICLGVVAVLSAAVVSFAGAQSMPMEHSNKAMSASHTVKFTVKIVEPTALRNQRKAMHEQNKLTIGETTVSLDTDTKEVSVQRDVNLHQMMMNGREKEIRVVFNGSSCPISVMGDPRTYPARMLTITIKEEKTASGHLKGVCKSATLSGAKA